MNLKLVSCLALCTYALIQKLECCLLNELNEEQSKIETSEKKPCSLQIGPRKADLYCCRLWVSKIRVLNSTQRTAEAPPELHSTFQKLLQSISRLGENIRPAY